MTMQRTNLPKITHILLNQIFFLNQPFKMDLNSDVNLQPREIAWILES